MARWDAMTDEELKVLYSAMDRFWPTSALLPSPAHVVDVDVVDVARQVGIASRLQEELLQAMKTRGLL